MSEEKRVEIKVPRPRGVVWLLVMLGFAIDVVLFVLKWPLALLSLAMLPSLAVALWDVLSQVMNRPAPLYFFMAGVIGYLLIWRFLSKRNFGMLFSTFEHELTHALFAWATFHRVVGFKVTRRDGGHVLIMEHPRFRAWLISLAPYFFPTLSVVLVVLFLALPPQYVMWADALLGVSVAYHVVSTMRELHWKQPDIQESGRIFSLLFLPSANLLVYGMLFSYALGNAAQFSSYMSGIYSDASGLINKALSFL